MIFSFAVSQSLTLLSAEGPVVTVVEEEGGGEKDAAADVDGGIFRKCVSVAGFLFLT